MKIIYLLDSFPKLSETFVRDEATWMADQCFLAGVAALKVDKTLFSNVSEHVRRCIEHTPIRYVGRSQQLRAGVFWLLRSPRRFARAIAAAQTDGHFPLCFWNAALIARRFKASGADFIHVHFAGDAAQIARYISLLSGIPYTVCVHHYDLFYAPPPNYRDLAQDAATIFTISEYNRTYLADTHGVPASSVEVIHCGIDMQRFRRNEASRRHPDERWKILSVGRLTKVKAHKDLVDACALLRERGIDLELRIIGDGELRADLERQIRLLGLTDRVILSGGQPSDAVQAALENADLFVMPSLSEGIPVALMEAMATEVPVIATRIRGVPELVEHDRTGLLVAPERPGELAEAIAALIDDDDRRKRLIRSGHAKVAKDFNAPSEYQKLVDRWRKAASPSLTTQG